jgi:peptidyl-prolyl cis-trans isomerase C
VQSSFGWHLIKLEGRREAGVQPFDQVRGDIVAEMRTKYVKDQREAVLDKIRDDPKTAYNEPVLDAYVMQARSTAAAGSAAKP